MAEKMKRCLIKILPESGIGMSKKSLIIIFCLGCFSSVVFAQINGTAGGLWNQVSLNGAISLEGQYRSQETILKSNLTERPKTSLLRGLFLLRSQSYVWHPNFLLLDLDLEYQPGSRKDNFLVIPDRSETQTAEKGYVRASFFSQRPLSLSVFSNLNHSYVNRELLTNIETYRTDFGSSVSFRNKIIPGTVRYMNENWRQYELQTDRRFTNKQQTVQGDFRKSFYGLDNHQLQTSYNDYSRQYGNDIHIDNQVSDFSLRDRFYFDNNQRNSFNSFIWYYHQTGSDDFDRFQIFENTGIQLYENLQFLGNYQYSWFKRTSFTSNQHNVDLRLKHQLFLSLQSQIYYEYSYLNQSAFKELLNTAGLAFNYRKKIPAGFLILNYDIRKRYQNHSSLPGLLTVFNEELRLVDGQTILLQNPFVDPNSVVVHDQTGTIIYQENIDYLLIRRADYIEIQRLPGGQIPDGGTVYVDYIATQLRSYKFDTWNNNFSANLAFFNNLIEFYFRYFDQDYSSIENPNESVLKYITQHTYGIRSSVGFLSAGFEYENYNSNIIPFRSTRYFISLTRQFFNRLNGILSFNSRNYKYTFNQESQKFNDLTGRFLYQISRSWQFKLDGGYRFQQGRGIDLNLTTFRAELLTSWHKLTFAAGVDYYQRDFSGEKLRYNGSYLRITRNF